LEGGKSVITDFAAIDGPSVRESSRSWWALALIAAALSFNFTLCFVNTNVSAVSNLSIVGCEFVILALTFVVAYSASSLAGIYFVIVLVLYLTFLALVREINSYGGGDIKVVRDFLIPVAFFWLGKTISLRGADRIVRWSVIAVICLGMFEYFFLDVFLKYFNVIGFYIARGTVADTESARISSGGLMVSGMRPESQGRELLPWLLGTHRVSSIFLEPSSLGNFGIIVALWAVLRSKMTGSLWWGLLIAGLCCIVLADTRFAAVFLTVGIFIVFLPPYLGTPLTAAMPFVAVLFLLFVVHPADLASNDTQGRLAYAALVLREFDIFNWIGLAASPLQTFDAGYGYLFSEIGLIGVLFLWFCFMALSGENPYFYALRNAAGAYFATLFLISQSQMTIKTAALLWLLLGAVSMARVPRSDEESRDSLHFNGIRRYPDRAGHSASV
jgi:putative polymerase